MEKKILIGSKVICPTIVSAMAIAKEDEFGRIIKGYLFRRFENFG
jgi:hypothetical protein